MENDTQNIDSVEQENVVKKKRHVSRVAVVLSAILFAAILLFSGFWLGLKFSNNLTCVSEEVSTSNEPVSEDNSVQVAPTGSQSGDTVIIMDDAPRVDIREGDVRTRTDNDGDTPITITFSAEARVDGPVTDVKVDLGDTKDSYTSSETTRERLITELVEKYQLPQDVIEAGLDFRAD
jgi:hypothetical protein